MPQDSTFHGTQTTMSDEIKATDHLNCTNSHAGANSYSPQLSSFQKTEEIKQQYKGILSIDVQHEKGLDKYCSNNNLATDSNAFQQYLIQKKLNHLAKADRNDTANDSLQHCLFMHTDLDVLDKDNLFNCHKCAAKKQRT